MDMTLAPEQIVVDYEKLLTTNLRDLIDIANGFMSDVFHRRMMWLSSHILSQYASAES